MPAIQNSRDLREQFRNTEGFLQENKFLSRNLSAQATLSITRHQYNWQFRIAYGQAPCKCQPINAAGHGYIGNNQIWFQPSGNNTKPRFAIFYRILAETSFYKINQIFELNQIKSKQIKLVLSRMSISCF